MSVKIYSFLYGKLCNSLLFTLFSLAIFKQFPSYFSSVLLVVSLIYLYYRSSGNRWNPIRLSDVNYHGKSKWSFPNILNVGYCVSFYIVNTLILSLIVSLVLNILFLYIFTGTKSASLISNYIIYIFLTYKLIDSFIIFLATYLLQFKFKSFMKFRLVCALILVCAFGIIKALAYLDPSKSLIISGLLTLVINSLSFDSLKVIKCIKNGTTDFDNCKLTSNQKFYFSLAKILTILGFVFIIISEFLADDKHIISLFKLYLSSSDSTNRGIRVFYLTSIIIFLNLILALLLIFIWKKSRKNSNHKLSKRN